MNKSYIALKKLNAIVAESARDIPFLPDVAGMVVMAEAAHLGYMFTKRASAVLGSLPETQLVEIIKALKKLKGADVNYRPMYPNFPEQVMDASEFELLLNAFVHYWSFGKWKPDYVKLPKDFALDYVKFREIDVISEKEFLDLFTKLLQSNDSLSEEDREIVEWYMDNESYPLVYPDAIPHKETMCIVAGKLYKSKSMMFSNFLKTSTDFLRFITYLNDGDISLTESTKFKSLKRRDRRLFCSILENIISEEDIQRHRNKWVRLFHNLHVGDYSQKLYNIAKTFRDNKRPYTLSSKVEELLLLCKEAEASTALMSRPGEFARRLDHLLRVSTEDNQNTIIENLKNIIHLISTRVLLQLMGHFQGRNNLRRRVVFPKGNMQKAKIIPAHNETIDEEILTTLLILLDNELIMRFEKLSDLGTVYIDPKLAGCPLPTQQRSASTALDVVARGTRLPIGEENKNTLRFFIYWIGQDIDLSASLHDEDFKMIQQISYTNLKSASYQACHSGDIVDAPEGASEFIDITMDSAYANGARYVVMNVFVYSGPNFNEHEKCYAGWMLREKPKSNEIYDPKTVVNKIDVTSASRNCIPVIFDLKTQEAIAVDLATGSRNHFGGNNLHSNAASIEDTLTAITSLDNKATLHDLVHLHVAGRGELVHNRDEAEKVFDVNFARNINEINSDFLV